MREAFSSSLVRLALADPRILLLTGDHGYALFDEFRQACSDQYINAGIAEQNMVGMAAGLARVGFKPFVYGLASFIPVRTVEQIKLDIAHDNLPVVMLGDGAGLVYSHLGTSHQSTEDIACMRSIPGIQILSPADRHEMTACMNYVHSLNRPAYLRMGKADRGDIHAKDIPSLKQGSLLKVREGLSDLPGFISTGSMVSSALEVANKFNLNVWSATFLKPINVDDVLSAAKQSNGLISLEEHSVYGGLGGAITEILSDISPTRVLRIGIEDRFSEHCGSYDYLLTEHGLDISSVSTKVSRAFNL